MTKNLLIAGGAGFVGSHLCDHFLAKGYEVTALDSLVTGSEENIKHLADNKNFRFFERDITEDLCDIKGSFDYVLNFASPASPPEYLKIPIETLRTGSIGTEELLKIALRDKAVFLVASTSEVYGDPHVHPQTEEYWGNVNPVGIRSCYDEAKRYAEAVTMAYHRVHGVDTKILRIFNTFGPRMQVEDGRAVTNFIWQALNDMDITVYGDGSQTRSFCYVTDMVDGIDKLLHSDCAGPINIGNTEEKTILELAELIIEYTGSESRIITTPLPSDDPKQRQPDIGKAVEELGWSPKVPLEEGLKKVIDYYRSLHVTQAYEKG